MKHIKGKLLYSAVIFLVILALVSCGKNKSGNDTETINKSSLTESNANTESDTVNATADLSETDKADTASDTPAEDSGNAVSETATGKKPSTPTPAQETDNDTSVPTAEANPAEVKPKAKSGSEAGKSDAGSAKADKEPKTEGTLPASKADTEIKQTDEKSETADSEKAKDKPQEVDESKKDDKAKPGSDSSDSSDDDMTDANNISDDRTESKRIVAIDAGHQRKGNYEQEPIGPGAKETKAKVSSGTQGRFTGVPEYELNLLIAKKVKDVLTERGYEVIMIRESHDVDLSNKERADIANESGAEIFIRIHANGSTNPSVHGTLTIYPSKKNPYVADLSEASHKLSKAIVDAICKNTGSKNLGAVARDDMSGINWSKIPVTIIEMGYMTNEKEDKLMQTEDYQDKIVQGICDGIDEYFCQ